MRRRRRTKRTRMNGRKWSGCRLGGMRAQQPVRLRASVLEASDIGGSEEIESGPCARRPDLQASRFLFVFVVATALAFDDPPGPPVRVSAEAAALLNTCEEEDKEEEEE
eukprot:GHVU01196175.1.p5 GENE.GHVU01196175.1~~GHVU01196175.1.p5  ORF type:complete len:109 (-),score=15.31 GHVU01196175.1:1854-2180(-)